MIGYLTGIIIDKEADGVVLDVGGVGYQVYLPLGTLAAMPPLKESVSLFIHTHVKEEELRLFGFARKQDRTAFRTLLKISGVGPKVALLVIGALDGPSLLDVVQKGDSKRLCAIPGIGKKTAERMILELGGKLDLGTDGSNAEVGVWAELESALLNLGFKGPRVGKVLSEIKGDAGPADQFGPLLKRALGLLQGS